MTVDAATLIEHDAAIPTWFGIGGRADHLARPRSVKDISTLLRDGIRPVRILGDGANLLVDDDGIDGLVLSLEHCRAVTWPDELAPGETGIVRVEAGMNLPRLILEAVRRGLGGIEGLGGIPATVGGAVIMNAGGAYGEIGSVVHAVEGVDDAGLTVRHEHTELDFGYRHSGLNDIIITTVELALTAVQSGQRLALRERLKEVMAYKKSTQPLAANSAGCVFRNPTVDGERVSAGRLIDEVGCKGLRRGGASVSDHHANFIVTEAGCRAGDVIALIDDVRERVLAARGVTLECEVVIWRRGGAA